MESESLLITRGDKTPPDREQAAAAASPWWSGGGGSLARQAASMLSKEEFRCDSGPQASKTHLGESVAVAIRLHPAGHSGDPAGSIRPALTPWLGTSRRSEAADAHDPPG